MKLDCLEVIKNLLEINNTITKISLIKFKSYNQLQGRVNFENKFENIFEKAIEIKNKYSVPFWDSFNASTFNQRIDDFSFLKEVTFHNTPETIINISKNSLEDFIKNNNLDNEYWTICSKVTIENNQFAHFFFLDFHIPVNEANRKICIEVIKNLKLKGYLLDSGKSYHFYSKNLMTEDELINKLAYSLLYNPIVDRAWIAHQIIERKCCLRISKKYDRLPYTVSEID